MQGRQSPGYNPWDRSYVKLVAATNANGNGKQRAIPQRPPGMTRVEHPPQSTRVARPQRQPKPPKSWWRRLLIFAIVFVACGLIAFAIGFARSGRGQSLYRTRQHRNTNNGRFKRGFH